MSQIYVPLHNHTHGSSLDGFATEEELAVRASEIGAKAVGITDHGECGRHYAFDQYCRSNGVKPIFGTEAYFVDDVDKSRERKDKPSGFDHACLWAYNNEGLRNLWTLSTISYDEKHFYYRPRMDFALLRKHSKGLAVSDGCLLSEVARAVNADDDDRAIRYLTTLADIFGKENVFIELHTWQFIDPSDDRQRSLNAEMTKANQGKLRLAKQLGLKTIAVNDAHYAWKDDHPYHELVWAGLKNKDADTLSDVLSDDGSSLGRGQTAAWVMTDEEIYTYLGMHGIPRSDIAEAIQNTADFADRCDAQIDSHPRFPYLTGDKEKDLTLFEKSIEEGFERKVPKGKEAEYRERVEYEKSVILAKNFHGYFNVVADYMKFAKEPDPLGLRGGIPGKEEAFVGAGRGSGASSLVSYLMDITEINPIRHDLPFERFLSMSRGVDKGKKIYFDDRTILPVKDTDKLSSLSIGDTHNGKTVIDVQDSFVGDFPDIDSDFPSSFAETIIGYLKRRYGFFHVAKVGTNQTSQAKNVFKDLARAYDVPYAVSNAITRAFPDDVGPHYFESKETLESLYRESPGLREHSMILEKVAPRMKKMVGRHRQFGAHASGYIITNESLLGELPMRYKDGELVTQFNLDELNDMGFIKYDILKIKALDVIDDAVRSAIENGKVVRKTIDDVTHYKNIKNVDPDDGWEKVDAFTPEMIYLGATNELDNPDIWAPTREGDSLGIFQMETNAGQRMAKRIKVMNVTDGAVMSAVNRPGMTRGGHADKFIARRDGEEQVTYPHPMLEEVVGETEGFFVFQEQVMRLFSSLAGYTMEEADSVRKIISKMQADKMDGLHREFVDGCKSNPDFVAGVPSRYESIEACCDDIWEMIKYTVEYAFNMAHATSYAYLSGWQSWLKVNFLTEFIKASITYSPDEVAKYSTYAKRRGISVLRPDVNKSKDKFTIEETDIRAPLSLIANVGDRAEKDILDGQPFKDIEDFENRTSNMGAKRMNVYHNLVLSGAFDDLESDRWKLLGEVYTRKGKVVERGHEIVPDISVDISTRAKVAKVEEEIMGMSFSFDPMVEVEGNLKSEAYSTQEEVEKFEVWDKFPVYGKVIKIKKHKAKNGEMAWLLLELKDFSEMDVTMFSETWNANKYLFESGDVLLLSIQRSRDYNDNRSYVVKQMINMTDHLSSKEL